MNFKKEINNISLDKNTKIKCEKKINSLQKKYISIKMKKGMLTR